MAKITLQISFIILLFLSFGTQAQVWKKQAKSGNAGLVDVVFISKSTGFVLSAGKILKTTDTGKTWNQILSGYNRFSRIQFTDANNGYIIGYDDLVLKTTDGGANWTLKPTGNSDDDLVTLFAKNKDTLFVAGPNNIDSKDSGNYLDYTYNGGNSWNRRNLNSKQTITSMFMWTKNKGFLGTLNSGLYETINGFSNYNVNTGPSIQIMDAKVIKDSIIVLVGKGGKISRSTNYGKTYKSISSGTSENLNGLHFSNDTCGMACGEKGTLLYTINSGESWSKMTTNTQLDFSKVYVLNPYLAWAVAYSTNGDSMDIFKFEDKSCISRFVKVPRDTAICDKYTYETPFKVTGKNKPSWEVNDFLTNLYQKNDSVASIIGTHEGKFIITFALQNCEEIVRDTAIIYIWHNPHISVKDSLYCGSVNDRISFSCFACQYLWSTKDNATSLYVSQPGKYWVRVENHCGILSDTFTLSYLPYLKLNLGKDTLLCNQETLALKNTLSPGKYKWNDGDTSSSKTISKAGKYFLNFDNKCNKLKDTIAVSYKRTPILNLGKDSIYCTTINHSISLDSVKSVSTITWWDSSHQSNRNFLIPQKYYATINNECGKASDTIQLGVLTIPQVSLGKDTIYCQDFNHKINLNPSTTDYKIEWSDGKDSVARSFTNPGTFAVKILNRCGEVSDTLKIDQKVKPVVDLGRDTSLKKPFSIQLDARNSGSEYKWSIGAASPTITVNDFGKYWVTVSNYCGVKADTILIRDKAVINHLFRNTVSVYPNPVVDGKLFIENMNSDFELQLFDQFGNLVLEKSSTSYQQTLDIKNFSKGVYYLKIEGNGVVDMVRIMKF